MIRPHPLLDTASSRYAREELGRPGGELGAVLSAGVVGLGLEPGAVALAAEVARLPSGLEPADHEALLLLLLAVMADVQRGSTRTPFAPDPLRSLFAALCRDERSIGGVPAPVFAADRLERVPGLPERASAVIGRGEDARAPLVLVGDWLYLHRMLCAEQRLAERVRPRLEAPTETGGTVEAPGLSDEQRAAVLAATRQRLTLVSGGPGTGKTSIVVALIEALVRAGVDPAAIALAAPTGKAADRMGESLRARLASFEPARRVPAPATLHRLLGYDPRRERFRHHPHHPLPVEAVVVDESSMVDVRLMERLLAALPDAARLVLLGDEDQLPSVAAGAVFRDLLRAAPARAARLTRSYRMRADDPAGAAVLQTAQRVNAGDTSVWRALPPAGVIHVADEPRRFLEAWHERWLRGDAEAAHRRRRTWRMDERDGLDALFRELGATRVLCATRGFDGGADRSNARLHALTAAALGQPAARPFLAGEPVMYQRNDYDRRLFNGDTGCVLWCDDDGRRGPMAVFPGVDGYRAFRLDALAGGLALAYATTVHKAQGSEFDEVAVLLPTVDLPILTRELLYTAITRSRRHVTVVGDLRVAERATARPVERRSGLVSRLKGEPG